MLCTWGPSWLRVRIPSFSFVCAVMLSIVVSALLQQPDLLPKAGAMEMVSSHLLFYKWGNWDPKWASLLPQTGGSLGLKAQIQSPVLTLSSMWSSVNLLIVPPMRAGQKEILQITLQSLKQMKVGMTSLRNILFLCNVWLEGSGHMVELQELAQPWEVRSKYHYVSTVTRLEAGQLGV